MRLGVTLRAASIGVGVVGMNLPVGRVRRRQFRRADDQQVLGVMLLGGLGAGVSFRQARKTLNGGPVTMVGNGR